MRRKLHLSKLHKEFLYVKILKHFFNEMSLRSTKATEIPQDAVILSEKQALNYQTKLISSWDPASEVWALRYGDGILGSLSVFTAAYINNHYRTKVKLGSYGKFSSYLPIVVLPTIISTVFHKMFIQRPILLQKEKCPVCIQTRAALFQSGFSVILPIVLSPLSSFMFATRHFTYRLPSITKEPLEVLKLWRKFTIPLKTTLYGLVAFHSLVAMFISYKEIELYYKLQMKMQEIERRIEINSFVNVQ